MPSQDRVLHDVRSEQGVKQDAGAAPPNPHVNLTAHRQEKSTVFIEGVTLLTHLRSMVEDR